MLYFATVPFSMEKPVRFELEKMNIAVKSVTEGRVYFEGSAAELAKACVNLRCADRVFCEIASFRARTFDELFDNISRVEWADIISPDGKINVSAKCARSSLMSVPDVQKISKMAIVRSMQRRIKKERLPETGAPYPIDVHINKDEVTVALDCCGTGLHKRGYRIKNAVAPLRETFAAGLLDIAGYRGDAPLCDPFCGSGTILIEAAMKAVNIAPNAGRTFACESFKGIEKRVFDNARRDAANAVTDRPVMIFGSDISPDMIELTRFHAKRAGVDKLIKLETCAAKDSMPKCERGMILTNPPYGERIGDAKFMRELCGEIKTLFARYAEWDKLVLSGYKPFERELGMRAKKSRRLYNGNIECNFYRFGGIKNESLHNTAAVFD